MNLKVVSKTMVEGENNLSIQLDRGKVKYSIDGKHINVEVEHGVGEISIFSGSIRKWFPPFSDVVIDDFEKQEILNNVCSAMKLLGVGFIVE
jgi:hypothetical protein